MTKTLWLFLYAHVRLHARPAAVGALTNSSTLSLGSALFHTDCIHDSETRSKQQVKERFPVNVDVLGVSRWHVQCKIVIGNDRSWDASMQCAQAGWTGEDAGFTDEARLSNEAFA